MLGKIDISALNVPPETHEFETAKYFADLGKSIIFLKSSSIPNLHTPDILMDGVEWEIKCPSGCSKHTIVVNFRKAITQSKYIIFDLRHIKLPEKQCVSRLEKEFFARPYLKRLYVILKSGELLIYPKTN